MKLACHTALSSGLVELYDRQLSLLLAQIYICQR